MVRACEKNVNQQNRHEVAGMEAKYRLAQRQAKETMDGEAVEVRGSKLKEIEQTALFLDRSQWKNFVTDRP